MKKNGNHFNSKFQKSIVNRQTEIREINKLPAEIRGPTLPEPEAQHIDIHIAIVICIHTFYSIAVFVTAQFTALAEEHAAISSVSNAMLSFLFSALHLLSCFSFLFYYMLIRI